MAASELKPWLVIFLMNLCYILSLSAACDPEQDRCPCLRYTYKMATYNNKCFQFYYGSKTWKEAKDYCIQQGGRLAMVSDPETFSFIRSTLNSLSWSATDLWIGAHDMVKELKWTWTNYHGEPDVAMTWSYWAPEHPEGWFHDYKDCVLMKKDHGQWKWHEAMCHTFPFEYKFICEYEMFPAKSGNPASNDPHGVGGFHQQSDPDMKASIPHSTSPQPEYTIIRQRNNQKEPDRGAHIIVNDRAGRISHLDIDGQQQAAVAESTHKNQHHVPIYIVVIAFICGTAVTLVVVLFIIMRRRKKRKAHDAQYPDVIYHAHPGHDDITQNQVCAGAAAGDAPLCAATGKLCKVAVDMGAEACVCAGQSDVRVHNPAKKKATPNVYVSTHELQEPSCQLDARGHNTSAVTHSSSDGRLAAQRIESPTDSSLSSSLNNLDEAPPTYDEACAGMLSENTTGQEPHYQYVNHLTKAADQPASAIGAIPKQPNKMQTAVYLPMDGSNKSSPTTSLVGSRSSINTNINSEVSQDKDTSQYLPMSLGDLPPVPTDDGYEIPVSRRLKPEAVREINESSIYSEIPDSAVQSPNGENEEIYSTID